MSQPNQVHKKRCMVGVLADAVRAHNAELAALLGPRQLRLIVETEDFGVVWRGARWRLPAFAMCTGAGPGRGGGGGCGARRARFQQPPPLLLLCTQPSLPLPLAVASS